MTTTFPYQATAHQTLTKCRQLYLPVRSIDVLVKQSPLRTAMAVSDARAPLLLPRTSYAFPYRYHARTAFYTVRGVFAFSHFRHALTRRPFLGAILIASLKTAGVDVFTQKVLERRDQLDRRRTALFAMFGAVYCGAFMCWLYSRLYPAMFYGVKFKTMKQIAFDIAIQSPLIYFPMFYAMKGAVFAKSGESKRKAAKDSLRLYFCVNFVDDFQACAKVWTLAHCVTFSIAPQFRAPWCALVSVLWTAILSTMRGERDKRDE